MEPPAVTHREGRDRLAGPRSTAPNRVDWVAPKRADCAMRPPRWIAQRKQPLPNRAEKHAAHDPERPDRAPGPIAVPDLNPLSV